MFSVAFPILFKCSKCTWGPIFPCAQQIGLGHPELPEVVRGPINTRRHLFAFRSQPFHTGVESHVCSNRDIGSDIPQAVEGIWLDDWRLRPGPVLFGHERPRRLYQWRRLGGWHGRFGGRNLLPELSLERGCAFTNGHHGQDGLTGAPHPLRATAGGLVPVTVGGSLDQLLHAFGLVVRAEQVFDDLLGVLPLCPWRKRSPR